MSEPAHVFVCYSALSLDAARRLVGTVSKNRANCHLLVLFGGPEGETPDGARVHRLDPPAETYGELTRPFATAWWFAHWLSTVGKTLNEIVAYIPHPLELPGNYFAFSDPRVTRLELLPDGLINYYAHLLEPESLKKRFFYRTRMLLRQLAALAVGLNYRYLSAGHITQYERGIYARTWTENPRGMISVCGVLEILPARAREAAATNADQERILLVLDQELHQIVDDQLERKMRHRLLSEILAFAGDHILYKCHPRGKNRHMQLTRWLKTNVVDVSGVALAEELIESHGITDVLGFYSTPLVLSADHVRTRVSVLPGPDAPGVLRSGRLAEIRSALTNTGVRIVGP